MAMDDSYETNLLEQKTEKLGIKLAIISVLIPVIVFAAGFFVYTDIQKSIAEIQNSKKQEMANINTSIEDKIFKSSSKTAELESKLSDYKDILDKTATTLASLEKSYKDINFKVEKSTDKDDISKNSKLLKSIETKVNENHSQIKKIASSHAELKESFNKLENKISKSQTELSSLDEKINDLTTANDELKSFAASKNSELQNQIHAQIKELEKNIQSSRQKDAIEKLNKSIDQLFKEAKKREIETRNLKDRLILIEKKLQNGSQAVPGNINKGLIEQNIQ